MELNKQALLFMQQACDCQSGSWKKAQTNGGKGTDAFLNPYKNMSASCSGGNVYVDMNSLITVSMFSSTCTGKNTCSYITGSNTYIAEFNGLGISVYSKYLGAGREFLCAQNFPRQ